MSLPFLLFAGLCGLSNAAIIPDAASTALDGGSSILSNLKGGEGVIAGAVDLVGYQLKYQAVQAGVVLQPTFSNEDIQSLVDVNAQLSEVLDELAKHWSLVGKVEFGLGVSLLNAEAALEFAWIAPRLNSIPCPLVNSLVSVDSELFNRFSSISVDLLFTDIHFDFPNPWTFITPCTATSTAPSSQSTVPVSGSDISPSGSVPTASATTAAPSSAGDSGSAAASSGAASTSGSPSASDSSPAASSGSDQGNSGAGSATGSPSDSANGGSGAGTATGSPSGSANGGSGSGTAAASGSGKQTQRCLVRPTNGSPAQTSFVVF